MTHPRLLNYLLTLAIFSLNAMKPTPDSTFTPFFIIDSGATHNILSYSYARHLGLLPYAKPTHCTVSGFDGSTALPLLNSPPPSTMKPPTTLKESYDCILGMPWLLCNGHLIDWANCHFLPSVSAFSTALSSPPNPSALDSPRRDARIQKRGCVSTHPKQLEDMLTPLHYILAEPHPPRLTPELVPAQT
ncbi:uncharacterized protein VP01_1754g3 [Puccinia sorghi]|uniref:Uncharacterized protein n=1 Tax=Puccinia sorghi TaxID=27349 RepID=A0A0L6VF07_9BASI|nr:uncharacterized protein VP01_1754g3 [Puccinia sorghi]